MARCEIKLPNRVIDELERLGRAEDAIAEAALQAGAQVVEPVLRSRLASSIGRSTKKPSRSTGQLVSALGTSPVKVNRKGNHDIKVGFAENRNDGSINALIANVLEYGRSNQPARPFLAPTKRATRKAALTAVKETLAREVNKHKPH